MITNTVSGSSKSGGLLVQAYKAGAIEEIQWVDLQVGDLIVSVAADAVRGPLLDRKGVRLPITYQEQVALCRELGCVSQTQAIADAMFARAGAQLNFVPLVRTAADSMKMATVDFSLRFHDGVEKQLASTDAATRGLAFGAWKLWILHPRIVERGAINYGFWDKSKKPAKPIQSVGGQHDAAHYDYSQVFQPVKRYAKHATTGETVDLLEHFERNEKIPARYLLPYKEAPTQTAVSFGFDTEPAEVDIVETLTAAGVNVKPADGWKTRGRKGFTPEGIMVHHTAGPKKGDAPTLGICIAGRPDLSGPLCHIVLARSGTAHVIAANIANHAGKGAQQVLDAVKKDEPVVRNAQANKYVDSIGGNQFFYGIEVENAGVGDDPYPEEQVQALARICAALCQAHGWSANRVIHHRQWTSRKIDMSYKGDLPGLVAQFMDAGACSFALEWSEEDAGELSENPEDPISSSDGEDDAAPTQTAAQTATQTATQTAAPADKKVSTPRKRKAPKSKKSAPKLTKGKARPAAKKAAAKRSTRPAAKKAAKRAAPAKKAAKRAVPAKKAAKKAAPAKKAAKKAAPAKKAAKRKAGAAKAKKRSG